MEYRFLYDEFVSDLKYHIIPFYLLLAVFLFVSSCKSKTKPALPLLTYLIPQKSTWPSKQYNAFNKTGTSIHLEQLIKDLSDEKIHLRGNAVESLTQLLKIVRTTPSIKLVTGLFITRTNQIQHKMYVPMYLCLTSLTKNLEMIR